jgi:coproporphyrinogen III oxidase
MGGVYKGDYSSTVNVWLADGTTFGFEQGGTLDQVNWSKASSVCQDKDFPPDDATPEKRATKFIAGRVAY